MVTQCVKQFTRQAKPFSLHAPRAIRSVPRSRLTALREAATVRVRQEMERSILRRRGGERSGVRSEISQREEQEDGQGLELRSTGTPPRRATIDDIARLASVSRGTASNVLNGLSTVKPRLRERVLRAAEELSFVPNGSARSLRRGRTHTVGILVPYLANLFFGHLVESAENVFHGRGYLAVTGCAGSVPALRVPYLKTLIAWRVEGLLVFPSQELIAPLLSLPRHGIAAVLVERDFPGATESGFDTVLLDHVAGVQQATQHLVELGHRRIGLVTLPDTSLSGAPRLRGYAQALRASGQQQDPRLIATGAGTFDDGHRLAQRLLSLPDPPTALIAATNDQGAGCLEALRAAALRTPEDISLIVYAAPKDGTASSASTVSTVTLPADELGLRAAELLLERIDGMRQEPVRELLVPRLEIRRSTAPPVRTR
jgi:DNA-binding LacI/PurR family transcriptional regulator